MLPLLAIVVCLTVLHWPGLWHGRVYCDEDGLLIFWAGKSRLYNLFHGLEPWSFWDPQPFLGMPRLADFQQGWFSPDQLFFALLKPTHSFRLYPFFIDLCLWWAALFFFRSRVGWAAAAWGAGLFVLIGDCLWANQAPPVNSALISMCLVLGFSLRWQDSGRRRDLLGLGFSAIWHTTAGTATHFFYHSLSLLLVVPWLVVQAPRGLRWYRSGRALLAGVSGILIGSLPWLPLADYVAHGSRDLARIPFSEGYTFSFTDCLRLLASESFVFGPQYFPPTMGGYSLCTGVSLLTTLLVFFAASRSRRSLLPLTLIALFILLQTMGEGGGLLWIVHQILPATEKIRAPFRFVFCFALLWAFLASHGLDKLVRERHRYLLWMVMGWAFSLGTWSMVPKIHRAYLEPAELVSLPLPPVEPQLRVGVDFSQKVKPPLIWLSSPITKGIKVLFLPHVISDRHYFRGLLYSQYGDRADELLDKIFLSATPVPPRRPQSPLIRSWGLAWLLGASPDGFGWQFLGPSPRHWAVVRVQACLSPEQERAWAAAKDWHPFEQASVSISSPTLGRQAAEVRVLYESPDRQVLETRGEASLLVTQDNWDPNWVCKVDGKVVPLVRANLALKSCFVPDGTHVVEWTYRPNWWPKALVLQLLGWLGLLAALSNSRLVPRDRN